MITNQVNITPGALYSHFSSKEEILDEIYKLYDETLEQTLPDMDELLKFAETGDPREALFRSQYFYDTPEIQEQMDRIITIASHESRTHGPSHDYVYKWLFEVPSNICRPILERMVELERIEPLDVEAFCVVLANLCYAGALRNFTDHPLTMENWIRGYKLLLSTLVPTGK
jgi:AcrR family transcriptional regulator